MVKKLSEILTRTAEVEIIPSELYDIVQDAVQHKLIGTKLLALRIGPASIPGSSVDVILQTKDQITVHEIAEGQEIPITKEAYSTFNLKPIKYGFKVPITREMQEDAQFDVMEHNLRESAYQMAKKLDNLILKEIETGSDANSTAHAVTGGTAITIRNITDGMLFLEADGYTPTDLILGPEPASDIRNLDTFVEADKAGVTDPSKKLIGTIFAMNVWVTRNANNTEYAYIIDKGYALCLAEKRPITIEKFDDVHRDLSGVVLTARWKARYLREDACAHIELS
jgi:HK97 family phage major capsid protein